MNSDSRAQFEGVVAMTIFTVTTTADTVADDGKLSLREAVRQANAGTAADRIVFASGLEGENARTHAGRVDRQAGRDHRR